jgi:hypothetical protein
MRIVPVLPLPMLLGDNYLEGKPAVDIQTTARRALDSFAASRRASHLICSRPIAYTMNRVPSRNIRCTAYPKGHHCGHMRSVRAINPKEVAKAAPHVHSGTLELWAAVCFCTSTASLSSVIQRKLWRLHWSVQQANYQRLNRMEAIGYQLLEMAARCLHCVLARYWLHLWWAQA